MRTPFTKIKKLPSGALLLSVLAGVLMIPAKASAACDACYCRAYDDYLPDHNGNNCSTSACAIRCAHPETLVAWRPELTGIEVSDDLQPIVIAVYPNSPAEQAAIKIGDTLLKVNGEAVPYSCQFRKGSSEQYLIRRGHKEMKFVVRSVSATGMLFRAFDSRFRKATFKHPDSVRLLPYVSGVVLRKASYGFLVEGVIPSTPADAAGLKKGARVLAILDPETNQPSNAGEGADYRATVEFVISSRGSMTTKTLRLRGLSEILSDAAASRASSPLTASLGVRP